MQSSGNRLDLLAAIALAAAALFHCRVADAGALDQRRPGRGAPTASAPAVSDTPDASKGPHVPREWPRLLGLGLNLGIGTPIGFAGIEGLFFPLPYLGIVAGTGVNNDGPQGALSVRPRLPLGRRVAISPNFGLSLGNHSQDAPSNLADGSYDLDYTQTWAPAYWLNMDLGCEFRTSDAVWLRFYMGGAQLNNIEHFRCSGSDPCPTSPLTQVFFYTGFEMLISP